VILLTIIAAWALEYQCVLVAGNTNHYAWRFVFVRSKALIMSVESSEVSQTSNSGLDKSDVPSVNG
jgi:hypothetical protein